MPGGDRTGPEGRGPLTGRGLGGCAGSQRPRFGLGRGFGRGRGWRHWARATGLPGWVRFGEQSDYPTAADEAATLEAEVEQLQAHLDALQKRLRDLKSD